MQRLLAEEPAKFKVLESNPYFNGLNPDILAEIILGMHLYKFERGEVIFWEGDECAGLHMIQSGSVQLYKISPQGRELVIKVLNEGATFNEVPVFDQQTNPINVSAIKDCEIWIIETEVIQR